MSGVRRGVGAVVSGGVLLWGGEFAHPRAGRSALRASSMGGCRWMGVSERGRPRVGWAAAGGSVGVPRGCPESVPCGRVEGRVRFSRLTRCGVVQMGGARSGGPEFGQLFRLRGRVFSELVGLVRFRVVGCRRRNRPRPWWEAFVGVGGAGTRSGGVGLGRASVLTSDTGLFPFAAPTARTARGRPIAVAMAPYVVISPTGFLRSALHTSR